MLNSFIWVTNAIVGKILTSQTMEQMSGRTDKMAATTHSQLVGIGEKRKNILAERSSASRFDQCLANYILFLQ